VIGEFGQHICLRLWFGEMGSGFLKPTCTEYLGYCIGVRGDYSEMEVLSWEYPEVVASWKGL